MSEARPLTAIVGAMPEETESLVEGLEGARDEVAAGLRVTYGSLVGHRVVVATCGIGKVNASALTQHLVERGVARAVFTGVAGGLDPSLHVGDVVVSTDAVQHDVDVTALGYEPGRVPGEPIAWSADPTLRDAALEAARASLQFEATDAARAGDRAPVAVLGRIASGDTFVADRARARAVRTTFGAACAEMEGAAVAQVCARAGVPWVVVRSLSDAADDEAGIDFRTFTVLAARRAQRVVHGILDRLS